MEAGNVNLYNYGGLTQTYPWSDPKAEPKKKPAAPGTAPTYEVEDDPAGPWQNTTFNNIRFNTYFKDDLFTALPKFNVGEEQKRGEYFGFAAVNGSLFRLESTKGWTLNGSLGLTPFVNSYDNVPSTSDTVQDASINAWNFGGTAALKASTPRWYLKNNETLFYASLAASLDGNLVNGMGMLDWKVNTVGLYLDNTPFIFGSKIDWALKLFAKGNIEDSEKDINGRTASDYYKEMYGANDLDNTEKLQALWAQASANIRWDDVEDMIPNNANIYFKKNAQNAYYLVGATFNNSMNTSLNFEFGKDGPQPLFNIYLGQRFQIGQSLYAGVNLGLIDLANRDTVSALFGLSLSGRLHLFGEQFNTQMNLVYHWDNIRLTKSRIDPYTWTGDTNWPGLVYNPLKGPEQLTHEFRFSTTAMSVAGARTITLLIGSNNTNHENGIEFADPDGNYIPGNANVRISDVQIYDETLPPAHRLIPGAGSTLVGKTLSDIASGNESCTLPSPRNGVTARYTVVLKLTTNTGDFMSAPAIPTCNIRVTVKRE